MKQSFVPVLLLTTVALSSSNVLPMLPRESETLGVVGQQIDNIFSDNNLFYTIPFGTSQNNQRPNKASKYMDTNNDRADAMDGIINKEDKFDGEGFRKEQWHNYPRQLDRLHKYLFENYNSDSQYPDMLDPDDINDAERGTRGRNIDDVTNEFHLDSQGANNNYDTVLAATKPLLILKIHLACLKNGFQNTPYSVQQPADNIIENVMEELNEKHNQFSNEINSAVKVKREGATLKDSDISDGSSTGDKKMVSKRLFSLFSRLQSLSHKGHNLPHRRHFHAFYGMPDAAGNGALTAETRATFIRPPGSPLRWG